MLRLKRRLGNGHVCTCPKVKKPQTPEDQKEFLTKRIKELVAVEEDVIYLTDEIEMCRDITEFPIDELLKGKQFIKELYISYWPKEIPFPEGICELENLEKLDLSRYPFPNLPENFGNLKNLEYFVMYGSNLKHVPASIGKIETLRRINIYTSYNYHYLPYEVKNCNLRDTTMSTRALFNNPKNKMPLPPLPKFPPDAPDAQEGALRNLLAEHVSGIQDIGRIIMDYYGAYGFACSRCKRNCTGKPLYIWSWERVGTDEVALLGRMCSRKCVSTIEETRWFYTNTFCNYSVGSKTSSFAGVLSLGESNLKYKYGLDLEILEDFYKYNFGMDFESFDFYCGDVVDEVVEMNVEFEY